MESQVRIIEEHSKHKKYLSIKNSPDLSLGGNQCCQNQKSVAENQNDGWKSYRMATTDEGILFLSLGCSQKFET